MFEHKKITQLDDYFNELDQRKPKGVYFYRITAYNDAVDSFIKKYYEAARRSRVIIEGRIPNPDNKNLAYYEEIMGMNFSFDVRFIDLSLKKWLPRMSNYQRTTVCEAIYSTLEGLKNSGKNDNMLKNAYIKFMCWLYYRFESIVSKLGDNKVPMIL